MALAAILGLSPVPAFPDPLPGGCPVPDSLPVRAVRFEGLNSTREHVVRREIVHRPGAIFSCSTWVAERVRLEDLDIFADIGIRAETVAFGSGSPASSPGCDLVYVFRELPPYIPFVSVLLTDQDGFSAGPALASFNFLGLGLRAEFMARFGGTTEFQASLGSYWLGNWPLEFDLAALHTDSYNPFEKFHEDSWRLKLDLKHRVGERSRLLYSGELFTLRPDGGEAAPDVHLGSGTDVIPRLGGGYSWDGRDRRHNPRSGLYQEWRVTQNGGWLGGDADYLEWLSDTRAYLPWLGRNVLHLGALYQYRTGTPGKTFPVYDRFHAGGVNTLRGFGNDAFQGKSEWIATLENRVDLFRKTVFRLWNWSGYWGLQGVAGVEAAALWDHDAFFEGGAETGAYVGLHALVAGIDRIRLEVGSNTAKLRIEAGIGILEKPDVQRFRAR